MRTLLTERAHSDPVVLSVSESSPLRLRLESYPMRIFDNGLAMSLSMFFDDYGDSEPRSLSLMNELPGSR